MSSVKMFVAAALLSAFVASPVLAAEEMNALTDPATAAAQEVTDTAQDAAKDTAKTAVGEKKDVIKKHIKKAAEPVTEKKDEVKKLHERASVTAKKAHAAKKAVKDATKAPTADEPATEE